MTTPLTNSRRIARLSSYTPIRLPAAAGDGGDVVNTAGLIRSLDIVPAELDSLRTQATTDQNKVAALAIASLVQSTTADQILKATAAMADVPRAALIAAVDSVRTMRNAVLASATAALNSPPSSEPGSRPPSTEPSAPAPSVTAPSTPPAAALRLPPGLLAASRWRSSVTAELASDVGATPAAVVWQPQSARLAMTSAAAATAEAASGHGSPPAMTTMSGKVNPALVFLPGRENFGAFLNFVEPYIPPGTDLATLDPLDALEEIDRKCGACNVVIDALSRRDVQPLGLLHLESLEMTPTDVERGELVYSLPLSPHEKVTLSHKEWAVRETEFSEFVQDSIENYSERGVVETDEIAISAQSETRRTDRTGMGSSGGVTMTGPADAGSTVVTNTQSQQQSRSHAQTVTSEASSRSVRDHKVSFTVATVSGTEDFTSRLIENAKDDRAMRIDYFRRMKRWKIDLYRTGVRLAYDVVIPDPGHRLRLRQDLIRKYDRALASSFNPGLDPADVDRYNWMQYASAYGIALAPPPADSDDSSVFKQWQMNSFSAMRDAAYAKFTQVQESIRQRRADLARQIDSAADADTLRQMEREEIVRLILAWLVPGFPGSASAPGFSGEPQGLTDSSWQEALEFGEYIKFVHAAVDWARLAYFLYPYFWSDHQVDRLFLNHPDPAHRDFLRAGAARVVVPIVPGFEEELTSFVDQGRVGKLPNGHRFGETVAAVRQANTADFAIAAVGASEPGEDASGKILIGSWTESTPTGALDIDVVTMPVQEL